MAPRLDGLIAVSPTQIDAWLGRRVRREHVHVITNGVETPRTSHSKAEVRASLGLPDDAVIALFVATLRPEKRAPDFVRAVLTARMSNPGLIGLVAGDGPDRAVVETLSAGDPAVQLLGHRSDIPDLLGAADIFVLTSEHEAVPMAILEAMAAGLPVVATSVGDISNVIAHGENGWLVPPADTPAIAQRLVELAADRDRRVAMGAAGRACHHQRWGAEAMIERYAQCLELTAESRRRERITMLVENNPYPGDVRVRAEAESLARAGHTVTVVAPRGQGQLQHESVAGVQVRRYRLPEAGSGHWHGFVVEYLIAALVLHREAVRALMRGATVLHIHNPPDILFPAGALFRAAGRKVIFDHHDLFPETAEIKFGDGLACRMAAAGQRLTLKVANVVIATNASYAEIALREARKSREQVTVVRNGPPGEWTGFPIHNRTGNLDRVELMYAGTIACQDGVDGLVPVLVRLQGTVDARLTIIGDGVGRPALEFELERHGVADRVTFTGWVAHEQVPSLLASADICVEPAPGTDLNQRSTMMKLAEYLALGKPVVAYRTIETERTVGEAACLVPPGDVDAFAAQILLLARNPGVRLELARQARRRAAGLTWDHSERALLQAYASLRTP
jgi:glycosyltransferase involved in cell wall biosynthesis